VLLATLIATLIGIIAGYSKAVGNVLMRVVDVFFAIPNVLLAVAIGAALGPGLMNVMIAIGIYLVPWISRIVYVEVVSIRNSSFVEAARVCGSSSWQIMVEEILPNAISPIIVASSIQMGSMITVAAGMSFLGLGVQPPTSDWGILVATGRDVLATAPQVAGIPGLLILIVAASFNLLGDGLRDALDPRLHTSKSQV